MFGRLSRLFDHSNASLPSSSSSSSSRTLFLSSIDDEDEQQNSATKRQQIANARFRYLSSANLLTFYSSSTRIIFLVPQFLAKKMLSITISGLSWPLQISALAGMFTLLWILLKFWKSVREQQIRIIPASWNGIHAHQWSLIQCLTHHRATCCVCRSMIVDAMFCDSCGVCLDFGCYQNYISRFGGLLMKNRGRSISTTATTTTAASRRKSSGTVAMFETLGQCKSVSISVKAAAEAETSAFLMPHQWIHGNLPAHSMCFVCKHYCDDDDFGGDSNWNFDGNCSANLATAGDHSLYHYRCCWCQRAVHETCFAKTIANKSTRTTTTTTTATNISGIENSINRCDFGRWRRFVLPPFVVIHRQVRGRAIALEEIRDFRSPENGAGPRDWAPLFVVTNRKSGNNDAGHILRQFLTVLNPLQVVDMSENAHALELALQICRMLPAGVRSRILVAGGDGTVGWVLNTIQTMMADLGPDRAPAVAIYPLGTGNDLARVLGWYDEQSVLCTLDDAFRMANSIYRSTPIELDRWSAHIRPNGYYQRSRTALISRLHIPKSILPAGNRSLSMYNYFSVGVDALVTLNFHETRKSPLYKFLFTNTIINKFIYFTYGTKDLLERRCANLHQRLTLELDGVVRELPELESIVLLNIDSWAGGAKLRVPPQIVHRLDDQLIEVFGLTSSFHIGQVMIGMAKPIFLGQARTVRLIFAEHLPVQVDGEPWIQSPAQIELSCDSRAIVLKNTLGAAAPDASSHFCTTGDDEDGD